MNYFTFKDNQLFAEDVAVERSRASSSALPSISTVREPCAGITGC